MSKLYNRIDSIDLTSILSENEALDKLKESDEKYCRNCFNVFEGEGDLCDECKSLLKEISQIDRDTLDAVREIEDQLAIEGYTEMTELDYDGQRDLIVSVLDREFKGWGEDLFNSVVAELGLNSEALNIYPETLDITEGEKACDCKKDAKILIDDLQGKISKLKAGIEGLDKLEEISDDNKFEVDGEEYTKTSANKEIKKLESKLAKILKNRNDDLDNAFGDNELRESEEYLKPTPEMSIKEWYTALAPDDYQLDKIPSDITFQFLHDNLDKYSISSLIGEIDSDPRNTIINAMCDVFDIDDAYSVEYSDDLPPYERNVSESSEIMEVNLTQIDLALDALIEIEEVIEIEGSIDQDLMLSRVNIALDELKDPEYEEARKPLQNILDIVADERSIDQDLMLSYVKDAMDTLNRMALTESIMTTTTVDNIDQESKDKATIDKAIEIAGDKTTIDNDTFRDLRLKLANKDYDVIDRLKDYALVRGEEVIYTWLRAEDNNLKEEVNINISNGNVAIDTDNNVNVSAGETNISVDNTLNEPEVIADLPSEEPITDNPETEETLSDPQLINEIKVESDILDEPEYCYSQLPSDPKKLIMIVRGQSGYLPLDVEFDTEEKATSYMNRMNDKLGVDEKQQRAMMIGSMYGWDVPGAKVDSKELDEEEYSFDEIINRMANATDYDELYAAANLIVDPKLRNQVEELISSCEEDNDAVEVCYSIVTSDLLDSRTNEINETDEVKERSFDKAQAILPLNNSQSIGIIVSDDGSTVQYMYSDNDDVYESDIEYDEDGEAIFKDEEGNVWHLSEFMKIDEDGMQVNNIPAKVDQDEKHKRLELAKLESDGKAIYRISYLKEDDEEIVGWDLDVDNDEEAIAAMDKFSNADAIADDLLTAEFISTGIDGVSSLNYKNTNIMLSTSEDGENIITINQDNEDPIILKGEDFDTVMNQLIYWFIMNLDEPDLEDSEKDNQGEDHE